MIPQTVAHQPPLSIGFSRQEYWTGLPFPPLEDLPDPGIEPTSLVSSALAGRFFSSSASWEAKVDYKSMSRISIYCLHLTLFNSKLIKGVEHLREYRELATQSGNKYYISLRTSIIYFLILQKVCNYSFKCQEFHTHGGVLKVSNLVMNKVI